MKINTNVDILSFDGKPITDADKKPIKARDIISNAINTEDQEHRLTAEVKNKAFQIGLKIWKNDEADLTVDQMALIKERVGFYYSPLIYGRICELLGEKTE